MTVNSVFSRTGTVVAMTGDYQASQVTNAVARLGGTVTPTAEALYFNVVDYGADPSGSTDSSSFIAAACAAASTGGGIVFFPTGTFLIGSPVMCTNPSTWVELRGAGRRATKLLASTTLGGNNAMLTLTGSGMLRDMTLDGGSMTQVGTLSEAISQATSNETTGAITGAITSITVATPGLSQSVASGMITLVPSAGTPQSFAVSQPASAGASILNVCWDLPVDAFPSGTPIMAPVQQGAGMAFMFHVTSTQTATEVACKIENCTFQNINQHQLPTSTNQYAFQAWDESGTDAIVSCYIRDCIVGPNTNPNQDAFSTNGVQNVYIENLVMQNCFRSGNIYLADRATGHINIIDPIPGSGPSGQNAASNRILCLGEAETSGTCDDVTVTMSDYYGVGLNVFCGGSRVAGTGWKLPGMDVPIVAITPNVSMNGTPGGGN